MRRIGGVLITVLLVVNMGALHASARSEQRVEKISYSSDPSACCFANSNLGGGVVRLTLPAGPERFLSLQVADEAGPEVAFEVIQDDVLFIGCTSTSSPIPITPNFPVMVELFNGRCPDGRPSVATNGSLTATFERASDAAMEQTMLYSPYTNRVGVWINPQGLLVAELRFPSGLGSRVSLTIADDSGTAVWGEVLQDDVVGTFCGSTSKPLRINPTYPVVVNVNSGVCPGGDVSVATRGSVTAEFSGAVR